MTGRGRGRKKGGGGALGGSEHGRPRAARKSLRVGSLFFVRVPSLFLHSLPPLPSPHRNRWSETDVNLRLDKTMTAAFEDVWRVASEKGLPLRTAAFVVALQRVTRAHLHRGFD